jgi:hypothetical protein
MVRRSESLKERIRMKVGVILYESGFNYFCYGRDLKVSMDGVL